MYQNGLARVTPKADATGNRVGIAVTALMTAIFFFGQCCARCNNSGSHEDMLN